MNRHTCAVCGREARGVGWFNPWMKAADPRQAQHMRWFCSRRCQNAYARQMKLQGNVPMDRPTELEKEAITETLPALGEYVARLGMERPLAQYSREEILGMVDVIVTVFQQHLVEKLERECPF